MDLEIKIENKKTRYGFIKGIIGDYSWFALVHRENVDYGINPRTLMKGNGKIVRLCIYKEEPFMMNTKEDEILIRRYIYADYKREWDVLSSTHIHIVKRLVDYLERRYNIKLIKGQKKS
jgi:hypothetical protein